MWRAEADAIVEANEEARIAGLRLSLAVLALIAVLALFFTRAVPTVPVGRGFFRVLAGDVLSRLTRQHRPLTLNVGDICSGSVWAAPS